MYLFGRTGSLLLLFLLFHSNLHARQIALGSADSTYIIGKEIELFFVPLGEYYTIEEVSSPEFNKKFSPSEQGDFPNFGYIQEAVWVKMKVKNLSSYTDWHLHIDVLGMEKGR